MQGRHFSFKFSLLYLYRSKKNVILYPLEATFHFYLNLQDLSHVVKWVLFKIGREKEILRVINTFGY